MINESPLSEFFNALDGCADSGALSLIALIKDLPSTLMHVTSMSEEEFSQLLDYTDERMAHEELSEILKKVFLTMRSVCTSK